MHASAYTTYATASAIAQLDTKIRNFGADKLGMQEAARNTQLASLQERSTAESLQVALFTAQRNGDEGAVAVLEDEITRRKFAI